MDGAALTVFLAALLTALATGLGALPFLAVHSFSPRLVGGSTAAAAGLMVAASVNLAIEGGSVHWARTAVGVALGAIFVAFVSHRLKPPQAEELSAVSMRSRLALVLLVVMTVHSFAEGVGVGVAYGGGQDLGVFITVAIAVHNIPEGLAISLTMVPRGVPVWKAAAWSIFSSLPQPLTALPAFVFVEQFAPALPLGLGFAAGAMAWMVAREMIPEARTSAGTSTVAVAFSLAALAMALFQILIG